MATARMRTPFARRRWMIGAALVVMLLAIGIAIALQPATANYFGYALPGSHGLPSHFNYEGQQYTNNSLCAGGSWCANTNADRISLDQAVANNGGSQLHQVGSVPTLFGSPRPIYEPINDPSMRGVSSANATPFVLYLADPGAPGWVYVYMRPGGP